MELYEMLKQLYAADALEGCGENEMDALKRLFGDLPPALEAYYRTAARTEAFHHAQDFWMLPEHFQKWDWLRQSDHLILLNENQGVCRAGVRRADLSLPDPPVYTTENDRDWTLCAPTVSEFLAAALAYESVFTFAFHPEEFYWLTAGELALLESRLEKRPFMLQSWVCGTCITYYGNAPDNLVAVMDCHGDLQMLYGAASAASYEKLLAAVRGLGEPV